MGDVVGWLGRFEVKVTSTPFSLLTGAPRRAHWRTGSAEAAGAADPQASLAVHMVQDQVHLDPPAAVLRPRLRPRIWLGRVLVLSRSSLPGWSGARAIRWVFDGAKLRQGDLAIAKKLATKMPFVGRG
jgi:hypothetical protein